MTGSIRRSRSILGGAALTRRYVEEDLRAVYGGPVVYADDAFDGLRFMGDHVARPGDAPVSGTARRRADDEAAPAAGRDSHGAESVHRTERRSDRRADPPTAPFWGTRVVDPVPLGEVFAFVNEVALIRRQWQVRKGKPEQSRVSRTPGEGLPGATKR